MAERVEIVTDGARAAITIDGHEVQHVQEYSLDHKFRRVPLLTVSLWVTGEVRFRSTEGETKADALLKALDGIKSEYRTPAAPSARPNDTAPEATEQISSEPS